MMKIQEMFRLDGKAAIITGGNGGIGLGMARALGQGGAKLILIGRNKAKAEVALSGLHDEGIEAEFLVADVSNEADCAVAVETAAGLFGRLDILINNAGTAIRKRPEAYTLADWHTVIDVNLTSAFMLSRNVYPHFQRAGRGKIINIGSIYSLFGASFTCAYSASKGGLVQLTKALASAWADDNIQVNAILPGWVDTDLTVAARSEVAGLNAIVANRTPAKRWGDPADFGGPALFLASSASNFVTGAALSVDGGFAAQG
jgi:2-deoxy-D-gluconate 3-dehydrogenase